MSKLWTGKYLDHEIKSIDMCQSIQQLLDCVFIFLALQPRHESIAPVNDDCRYTWYERGVVGVEGLQCLPQHQPFRVEGDRVAQNLFHSFFFEYER